MRNELLGWMRLIRHYGLFVFFIWCFQSGFTDLTQFLGMAQTSLLAATVFILALLLTNWAVTYIERRYFGETPDRPTSNTVFRAKAWRNTPQGRVTIHDDSQGYDDYTNHDFWN